MVFLNEVCVGCYGPLCLFMDFAVSFTMHNLNSVSIMFMPGRLIFRVGYCIIGYYDACS